MGVSWRRGSPGFKGLKGSVEKNITVICFGNMFACNMTIFRDKLTILFRSPLNERPPHRIRPETLHMSNGELAALITENEDM